MIDAPPDDDARAAFLFQCGISSLFAVSLDKTGANLPTDACAGAWNFREAFWLGVHEAGPTNISPEPILRGIIADGYFIWRKSSIFGTSQ